MRYDPSIDSRRDRADENRNQIESVRRKGEHHQILTEDVGHPALAQHLHAVVTLMRVSKNWSQFKLMLDVAHPKRGDTLQLPLMTEFATDPIGPKKDHPSYCAEVLVR